MTDAVKEKVKEAFARLGQTASRGTEIDTEKPIRMYWKSSQMVFEKAKEEFTSGNLEKSYVLFVRYAMLISQKLKHHPDYRKASETAGREHAIAQCNEALKHLEILKPKVQVIIQEAAEKEVARIKAVEEEKLQAEQEAKERAEAAVLAAAEVADQAAKELAVTKAAEAQRVEDLEKLRLEAERLRQDKLRIEEEEAQREKEIFENQQQEIREAHAKSLAEQNDKLARIRAEFDATNMRLQQHLQAKEKGSQELNEITAALSSAEISERERQKRLMEEDAALAARLQQQMEEEEQTRLEHKRSLEEHDAEFARQLQQRLEETARSGPLHVANSESTQNE